MRKAKEISVFYNNINGLRSKIESVMEIIKKIQPALVCICETKVGNSKLIDNKMEGAGYKAITRPIKDGQGGLMLASKIDTVGKLLDVTSTPLKNILVGRLAIRGGNLRIIAGYAPQETDNPETREEFFEELSMEIQSGYQAMDSVLVLGDLNAKLEMDENDNVNPESKNGKLLCELVEEQKLNVMNLSAKCIGKWTHVIRTTGETSRLDYVLAEEKVERTITNMIIDESTLLCPFHIKNKVKIMSDHNSILMNMKIRMQDKQKKTEQGEESVRWKIKAEGIEQLSKSCDKCLNTGNISDKTTQEMYDSFEQKIKMVLDECFKRIVEKKSKPGPILNKKFHNIVKCINTFAKKGKAQRKVATTYLQKLVEIDIEQITKNRAENLKKVVSEMTIDGQFNAEKYWKMRKSHNKKHQTCSSVIRDGKEVFEPEQIMHAFKEEFQERLEKPEMEEWLQELSKKTDKLLELLIECGGEKSQPFSMEELESVLREIKNGKSCGPDGIPPEIFKYGGEQMKKALLEIMNKIKESAEIPSQWDKVDITTLYKKKGKLKELVNQRGIFLTAVAYKLLERLIKKRTNSTMEKINLLQAGGREGRCTTDQTFIMRSMVNHAIYLGRTLYVTCYDYKQCFDKLWMEEAVLSQWRLGLSVEWVEVILKLNEVAKIAVKTPFGQTERFLTRNITKQGTVTGPSLCCSSLGECLDIYEGGAQIGSVQIPALAFVDDINTMATSIRDVHESHDKTVWFSERKNQPLHEGKCEVICINASLGDAVPVLTIKGKPVLEKDKIVYVGDTFNKRGNCKDLILDRVSKGIGCLRSTMAECGDVSLGQHAIESQIMMYKAVFVQTVLFNGGGWCNLSIESINKLKVLQMKFLKRILHAPRSTSINAVLIELGIKPIVSELHERQLNYLHKIVRSSEQDPVRLVYEQQKRFEFEKNWYWEVKKLLVMYNLEEDEEKIRKIGKLAWKNLVTKQVGLKILEEFNKQETRYPEQSHLGTKDYFKKMSPRKARILFAMRARTMDIRGVRKYMYDDTTCRLCGEHCEDVNHVINECSHITRTFEIEEEEIMSNNVEDPDELVRRMDEFSTKIKEKENESTCDETVNIQIPVSSLTI